MKQLPRKGVKLVRQGYILVDKLDSPQHIVEALRERFCDYVQEVVLALYLDSALHPLHYSVISQGANDGACVNPADVFRVALLSGATKIILLHNHPSGNVVPSVADISLTSRLVEVGDLLGVAVLDHIILGPYSYFSMYERRMIERPSCKYCDNLKDLSFSKCAEKFLY